MSAREHRILGVLILTVSAGLVGAQLFVRPIVGLANNGDFAKVMGPAGLDYVTDRYEERYFHWALEEFAIVAKPAELDGAPISETLLTMTAMGASRLAVAGQVFDIRWVGAAHLALLLGFLVLLGIAGRDLEPAARWVAAAMAVFCFTDVGYVAPFNSLYGQVASLLFFLLAAGVVAVGIRRGCLDGAWLVAYFVCAVFFVVSKPQEIVQAPVLAILGYRLARIPGRRVSGEPAAWLGLLLLVIAIWSYTVIPRRSIREAALFNSVFNELLSTSKDPGGDLRALGLDPELVRFVGVDAFSPAAPLGYPNFRAAFFERTGYGGLIRFYATRPERLYLRLQRTGARAFRLRPAELGNFVQSSGRAAGSLSRRFGAWSSARSVMGRHGLFWIVGLIGSNLIVAIRLTPREVREGLFRDGLVCLCAMAMLEFLVCAMADYLNEASRHLYVFQAMWDLLLIIDVAWMARILVVRRPAWVAPGTLAE